MEEEFCFIIMPFKEELQEVYSYGIKPAVEERQLNSMPLS